MKHGKYRLKDLLANVTIEQILIPEIQRDYVWEEENVIALITSIEEDANSAKELMKGADEAVLGKLSPELREAVQRSIEEKKPHSNIGFIYAYYDLEIFDRYYLIDGQQRITTLYLFLLALAVKSGKENYFLNSYFKNSQPKVDYKVRETAHEFLVEFIPFILEKGNVGEVKEQSWYFSDYENDKTIQSHIRNYKTIEKHIQNSVVDFEFAENNIELWYFDTEKSEQGEELYIYMNSRGEPVQPNENIKAQLLEGFNEKDKHTWGSKWEEWQNFFWKNKGTNPNADKGFDEFLRWVKIMEYIKLNKGKSQKNHADYIKEIKGSKKLSKEYLNLHLIEKDFNAIKKLSENKDLLYFNSEWLQGVTSLADYVRLLPVILYVSQYPKSTTVEINRFSRFFYNILRFEDVSKNPAEYASQVLLLVEGFLIKGLSDVTDLGLVKIITEYDNILTKEELFKFDLYKNSPKGFSREELEDAFWKLEDFKLSDGSIGLVLNCMKTDLDKPDSKNFKFDVFKKYSSLFQKLFTKPDDLLRRTLLTFGDFSFHEGNSPSLEMRRYNFGDSADDWRWICTEEKSKDVIIRFVTQLLKVSEEEKATNYNSLMEVMIDEYLELNPNNGDWIYLFIADSKYLKYCQHKRVCISDDETYLLYGKNATTYESIENF